jgi:L-ascorbate metabolism protein UlaG (beta-lactamase superfamily)
MKTPIFLCVLLLTVGCFACAAESPLISPGQGSTKSIKVTFIGNCGFLVQVGEKKILFDLEEPQREEIRQVYDLLVANKEPFNNSTAVFISHCHDDHIGKKEFAVYLKKNENIKLYSTCDTRDELKKVDPSSFSQIEWNVVVIDPYAPDDTGIVEKTIAGMNVEFLGLYHGGEPKYSMKVLAFVLHIDGACLFYLADVEPSDDKNLEVIKKWAAKNEKVDLLFSHWGSLFKNQFSPRGVDVVKEYIKPGRVIPMHIFPEMINEVEAKVKENFPVFFIFKKCLESQVFKKG